MLITSCKLPPPNLRGKKKKNKMMAPRHIMTSQPFTNSPSGNLTFQSRLANTALSSGYKKRQRQSKENGTEAAKQAGWWGDGSGSTELVRSLLLLFLMYFKLSSTRKDVFLIAEFTHFPWQQSSKRFSVTLWSQWHRYKFRWSQSNRLSRRSTVDTYKRERSRFSPLPMSLESIRLI